MHLARKAQANMWSAHIWYFVRISVGFHLPEIVVANCVRTCHRNELEESHKGKGADSMEEGEQAIR